MPFSSPFVTQANMSIRNCYCFGAAGFGVVGAGRGCVGAGADGAEGAGGATPDEVLYAVTTACVTSILGPIHITLLCWLLTSSRIVKPLSLTYFFSAAETFGAILPYVSCRSVL